MMVSQRQPTVIPNSGLELCQFIGPVEVNWVLTTPGFEGFVFLGKILVKSWEFLSPTRQNAISVGYVLVAVIYCHKIVHIGIEQIVQMNRWLEISVCLQKNFVPPRDWIGHSF